MVVFAMVTRASFGARLKWFQSSDWWQVSCMLRGLVPNAQGGKKSPMDSRRGFEKIAERETSGRFCGLLPARPGDKSRVWGVNSFAALPMLGGTSREDVAQQCGFCAPASPSQEKGTHSGLWLAAVNPDATATVSGVVSHVEEEAAGRDSPGVYANAEILGNLFGKWFGNCASKGDETKVLVGNALKYADRYALEVRAPRTRVRLNAWAPRTRVRLGPCAMFHSQWDMRSGTFTMPCAICDCRTFSAWRRAEW